jgi:HlyD family secretion protein
MKRYLLFTVVAAAAIAAACGQKAPRAANIQTVPVTRRDIVIDAQANGVVEPINVVEVKSKASGLITRMTVETGTQVKPGDLLVQVDTRDVQNQYNQSDADLNAAEARLEVSTAQKRRADEMFKHRVITAQEHETAALDFANARAAVVRARANLDLAKQRLEDATVAAPVAGTVIEKTVSLGQVITSATGAFGGGTTLLKMADLTRVRMRALFNETDIGQIRSGQPSIVIVDAYPDRRFNGLVEKIEPQAVVQQGVTLFPVLITLNNMDGALRPGMNGEVQVQIEQRLNVLAIPNDAIKNPREAVATAPLLGLDPDSVQAQLRAQFSGGARGGRTGAAPNGGGPTSGPGANGAAARVTTSPGVVTLASQQAGGIQMPGVTDQQCAAIAAAMAKQPDEVKKLEALRIRMQNGEIDRASLREESQKIYAAIGVDGRSVMACRTRQRGATGNSAAMGAARDTSPRGGTRGPASAPPQLMLGTETGTNGARVRPALVFVAKGTTFEPRIVMVGSGNFDYTEAVSGIQEGEEVALLASLSLQAQRQQQTDRFRQGMGGVPGMNQGGGGGGRGPR